MRPDPSLLRELRRDARHQRAQFGGGYKKARAAVHPARPGLGHARQKAFAVGRVEGRVVGRVRSKPVCLTSASLSSFAKAVSLDVSKAVSPGRVEGVCLDVRIAVLIREGRVAGRVEGRVAGRVEGVCLDVRIAVLIREGCVADARRPCRCDVSKA